MKLKTNAKKEHWLDYAADKYDATLIANIKAVLGILFLYLPLPLFWALFDQQVSTLLLANILLQQLIYNLIF